VRRHDRDDEARAVGDHRGKDGRDDGRLALAHHELVAERAAVGVRLKELVQQRHLRLTQQQPVRELVEQEVGLVHERRAGSVPLKVVAVRGERGG